MDRTVGRMMSQSSSYTVSDELQSACPTHTPTQSQVQLPPCIDPQRHEYSSQCRSAIDYPQAGELEWIGRHLDDLEVSCSKIAIPTARPGG